MKKKKIGIVIRTKMKKTIIVRINTPFKHNKYSKILIRSKNLFVHDTQELAKIGNLVEIIPNKPISKNKFWVLKQILA